MLPTRPLLANIYRARRPWPPDFSLLTAAQKFRLEKTYRRRMKLKLARPKLQKAVVVTQWVGALYVSWYCIFWAEWTEADHVLLPIRTWWKETKEGFWSVPEKGNTTAAKVVDIEGDKGR